MLSYPIHLIVQHTKKYPSCVQLELNFKPPVLLDVISVPSVSLPHPLHCLPAVKTNGLAVIPCNRNALSLASRTQIDLPQEAGTRIVSMPGIA